MRFFIVILTCLAVIILTAGSSFSQYYYGGGHAIPLKIDSTKITIKFDPGLSSIEIQSLLLKIGRITEQLIDNHVIDSFIACSLSTGDGYDSFIDSVAEIDGVYLVEPYYLNQSDSAFLVGIRFCVAFDEDLTLSRIDAINSSFNVEIDHEVMGMPNVFILRNTDLSGYGLLDLANAYYELEETRYSHPEFGVWIQNSYDLVGSHIDQHYYGGGQAIPLKVDSTKITIKFDTGISAIERQTLLLEIERIIEQLVDNHAIDGFVVCSLSTGDGYNSFIDSVAGLDGIYLVEPYYLNQSDSAFLVGTRFCVAFDESMTLSQIENINASYNVEIDHEVEGMPNVFVLRNTNISGYGLLDLANVYYELEETRYSHPEFGVWIQKHSYKLYDYYNDYQPHTKKVIGSFNSASVWDFAGLQRPVTVAVIDDGVTNHEDLPVERILPGYDYAGDTVNAVPDNNPSPGPHQAHGMGCTGIISASHTTDSIAGLSSTTGMISLNPSSRIYPIKIFDDSSGSAEGMFPSNIAEAITAAYAGGADILSNSWGYFNTCPGFDVLNNAIENATILGRGGLGCPVIYSSGNDATWFDDVQYPSCLPYTLSVGATRLDDYRWNYSSYGEGLDIVAPSAYGNAGAGEDVWTLDQMDNLGWNPLSMSNCPSSSNDVNYDCHFSGTSAACPVVSGTASLILAKDPTLTADEVYDILRHSAVKDLDWGTLPDTPHVEYGYGRVDAFRAILSISHGDVTNDDQIDISDITALIDFLYLTHTRPFPSVLLGDIDCDSVIDITDISLLINFLYHSGPPPVKPCYIFVPDPSVP